MLREPNAQSWVKHSPGTDRSHRRMDLRRSSQELEVRIVPCGRALQAENSSGSPPWLSVGLPMTKAGSKPSWRPTVVQKSLVVRVL